MKNTLVYIIAASVLTLTSCGSESEETAESTASDVKLTNRKDSLSYAFGMELVNTIHSQFPTVKNNLDIKLLIKGFTSSYGKTYSNTCEKTISQLVGEFNMDVNQQFINEGSECIGERTASGFRDFLVRFEKIDDINMKYVTNGLSDLLQNKKTKINELQKKNLLDKLMEEINREEEVKNVEIKKENEKLNATLFAEAKKIKGAQVFDNGIVIQELKPGTGGSPGASDDVQIEYILKNAKGETLQSTYEMKKMDPQRQPIAMNLAQVIPGWTFGLQKMKKGGKYKIFIPAEMAYGDQAHPFFGPGAALLFEIELLNFGKAGSLAAPMPQAPMNTGGGF
jgi:FKBP-type peptidyl-prolyl cis-trans isomerase